MIATWFLVAREAIRRRAEKFPELYAGKDLNELELQCGRAAQTQEERIIDAMMSVLEKVESQ